VNSSRAEYFPRTGEHITTANGNGHAIMKKKRRFDAAASRHQDAIIIPSDVKMEALALACVAYALSSFTPGEGKALLIQLRPALFWDARAKVVFESMTILAMDPGHELSLPLVDKYIRDHFQQDKAALSSFLHGECAPENVTGVWEFPLYLKELQALAQKRKLLEASEEFRAMATRSEVSIEEAHTRIADLFERTKSFNAPPMIRLVTPAEARAYVPDPEDFLVGDGLLMRNSFAVIGGEQGCGKSRLATTLAAAGALGKGKWMGYAVRNRFRSLILQTENSGQRLKSEFDDIGKHADDWIKSSAELSNGLAFNDAEFRREVTRIFETWPFSLLVIDPWNDLSADEGQSEFKMALANIRRCFYGKKMPCVVIIAHHRKPRGDASGARKRGRALMHEISGSLALGSTARTMFAVEPVSHEMDEDRIVFSLTKANDAEPSYLKEVGVRGAWYRRNGAFTPVEEFDFNEFDNPGSPNESKQSVTLAMLRHVLKPGTSMRLRQLARAIEGEFEVPESTAARAFGVINGKPGYLRSYLEESGMMLSLKKS